jgi:hypothetical protein
MMRALRALRDDQDDRCVAHLQTPQQLFELFDLPGWKDIATATSSAITGNVGGAACVRSGVGVGSPDVPSGRYLAAAYGDCGPVSGPQ